MNSFPMKLKPCTDAVFSPSGRYLATIDSHVSLWNSSTWERVILKSFPHPGWLDFSPDETQIAIKATSGSLNILSVESQVSELSIKRRVEGCGPVFSPGGERLLESAKGVREAILALLNPENGERLAEECYANALIHNTCRTPDKTKVFFSVSPVAIHADRPPDPGAIYLYSWDSGTSKRLKGHYTFIESIAINRKGEKLAVIEQARPPRLSIIDVEDGKTLASCEVQLGGTESQCAWSPESNMLAVVEDHFVSLRSTRDLSLHFELPLKFASGVDFSPDGKLLAIAGWKGGLVINMQAHRVPGTSNYQK